MHEISSSSTDIFMASSDDPKIAKIRRTCVVCSCRDEQMHMRWLATPMNLHVIVAYHKFIGVIPRKMDFENYKALKMSECFVCAKHVDVSARALRNAYAFPPETPQMRGKCDPSGFLRALRKYMPPEYRELTIEQLAFAIPIVSKSNTASTSEGKNCKLLQETRRRLKKVIGMAVNCPSSVPLNVSVFTELLAIEKSLDVEMIQNQDTADVATSSTFIDLNTACENEKHFLMNFEKTRAIEEDQTTASQFSPMLPSPSPSNYPRIAILPSYATAAGDSEKRAQREQFAFLTHEKENGERLPNVPFNRKLTLEMGLLHPRTNQLRFSPFNYSQQTTHEYAKAIMNSKLVVFSIEDIRDLMPDSRAELVSRALSKLAVAGLLHTDVKKVPPSNNLTVIYIKEFRRKRMGELWSYGIIPEHYRQRTVGIAAGSAVRAQIIKYKELLMKINQNPMTNDLIPTILADSRNMDLEVHFSNTEVPRMKNAKVRGPKIEEQTSESSSI